MNSQFLILKSNFLYLIFILMCFGWCLSNSVMALLSLSQLRKKQRCHHNFIVQGELRSQSLEELQDRNQLWKYVLLAFSFIFQLSPYLPIKLCPFFLRSLYIPFIYFTFFYPYICASFIFAVFLISKVVALFLLYFDILISTICFLLILYS